MTFADPKGTPERTSVLHLEAIGARCTSYVGDAQEATNILQRVSKCGMALPTSKRRLMAALFASQLRIPNGFVVVMFV